MKRLFTTQLIILLALSFFASSAFSKPRRVGRKKVRTSADRFAAEGLKMRKTRRMAIGAIGGGNLGLGGAKIELNFTPRVGFMAGYGGGKGFQSYSFELKHYVGGDSFLPYAGVGYAHWFGREREGGFPDSKPSFLVEKFLSDIEKATGEFAVNFVTPSLGIQYVKLEGDYAGLSIIAEVVMMVDVAEFNSAPTAALGVMYYF